MFDIRNYYKKENNAAVQQYNETLQKIADISEKLTDKHDAYADLFSKIAEKILFFAELEKKLDTTYFTKNSFKQLFKENHDMFAEIRPENYGSCYADPAYAVSIFDNKMGQLLSFVYSLYRSYISSAYMHKIFEMKEHNGLFIELYTLYENNDLSFENALKALRSYTYRTAEIKQVIRIREHEDKKFDFYNDIFNSSDLSDLRYLFKYGSYITDSEIRNAEFFLNYPDEKIHAISEQIIDAYFKGFERYNKNRTGKQTVHIGCRAGYEKLVKQLYNDFEKHGLKLMLNVKFSSANKQYGYDHRYSDALFLDDDYLECITSAYANAAEKNKDLLRQRSGDIVFFDFGETPFNPENKKECLHLDEYQQKLSQKRSNFVMTTMFKYVDPQTTSFTAIGFPTPEIGENFEDIFRDIIEVNTLDADTYEAIQHKMVHECEKASFIHVKGVPGNDTDIMVKIKEIENENETNFINCGADLNIPVGEIFTSPVLTDTNGSLHFDDIYLNDLRYIDLKFTIKDGYITEYTCANFSEESANKNYIKENLFRNQATLPIGEFAIGTNTLAFVTARKYNILNILPILIMEKTGPHFAFGDTCFFRKEDIKTCNFIDKKEMIAKDNEKSILRKTDPDNAYTNCHIDMTLPYDSLKFITVITKNNEKIDIIRDGRFVLPGTEQLNIPLDQYMEHTELTAAAE